MAEKMQWSDLPKELWSMIGKRLETRIDVLRFRSSCITWRSSIPPFHKHSPSFPQRIQHPFPDGLPNDSFLTQTTVYRLEPLVNAQDPSTSSSEPLLIKVEESESSYFNLLNPLSTRKYRLPPETFSKVIDLMSYRVVELTKAYYVKRMGWSDFVCVDRVVLFPNSAWTSSEECLVFAIYEEGKLGFIKLGDENWRLVDDKHLRYYEDIVLHKGKFYVVDDAGTISRIDTLSLKLIKVSTSLHGIGGQKSLVESCGSIYVVDMFFDGLMGRARRRRMSSCGVVDIKVYKVDVECGACIDVVDLGGRVFILGEDCNFSVSAHEFAGSEANCLYFLDNFDGIRVYNLEKRTFGTLAYFPPFSKLFCPPTTLFDTT